MIQPRPQELNPDETGTFGTGSLDTAGTAGQPSERFAQQTEELGHQAKQKASEALRQGTDSLREAGRQTKEQIAETTRRTTAQVQERASAVIADKKSRVAEEVGVFGQALHRAAETLDENDQMVGRYVHEAANMVDSCADWLRNKNASEMVRGCGDFTRRHPEVVLGGLFLAGIAAARFLKASERDRTLADSDFARTDRDFEGNFGEGHYGAMSDMDSPRNYDSGQSFAGTGGFGAASYAGTFDDVERSQLEDIPDVSSSQPGSLSSLTTDQTFDRPSSGLSRDLTDPIESTPIRDDDLNTIGRNDPSLDNSTKPR